MSLPQIKTALLDNLTKDQRAAVKFAKRRELIVAGAGSGKTEVMARRIAWWVGVEKVPKDNIVALTFTEKAAREMKFRVRRWVGAVTPSGQDVNLGGMYVGTIHGYCLEKLREFWPDTYHNFDILDESARSALLLRGFSGLLGLQGLRSALGAQTSQSDTLAQFVTAYDQLHEHNRFDVQLPAGEPPYQLGQQERDWCINARLLTDVGSDKMSEAFATSAARYYAYLRCRRFLDFSTSQTEFLRRLNNDNARLRALKRQNIHIVVDEMQDVNPVQRDIIKVLVGASGKFTGVGDHRQAIYGFRGAKVDIIGALWKQFRRAPDADVVDLRENFRSTPRIIHLANEWAKTISPAAGMATPAMRHGKSDRQDVDPSHVALVDFGGRQEEARWIAEAIRALVPSKKSGAQHDRRDGRIRGISLSDIAILVRSSTDVRTYMEALEGFKIPAVVKAGPDLFSQPEVLCFVAALAISGGLEQFYGSPHNPKSLPNRINSTLGCGPYPEEVLRASLALLAKTGLSLPPAAHNGILIAAKSLNRRIVEKQPVASKDIGSLRSRSLRKFLASKREVRRVFPQQIYHWLLTEAQIDVWPIGAARREAAMFHLGTLSGLITGVETPGWTSAADYKWQIVGLCQYGAEDGRTPEQPLTAQPDAVTISTAHGAKGLEFAAVFLADVCARRFPSARARRAVNVPLSGPIIGEIDIPGLSDNDNYDGERRLMYVALTRAERFLVISRSGSQTSRFVKELAPIVDRVGGTVTDEPSELLNAIRHAPIEKSRQTELSTSFSDLRYYLECPHDFYLRKVLGFAPTIDQAFGYGRGVHNLLRAVHAEPAKWAALARDRKALERAIEGLIGRGMFYLRYTTGDPAMNMREKGARVVADYVEHFLDELQRLRFEPEKEFETLVEYEDGEGAAMISGAVDIVRLDEPPRVTLIDFKSGDPDSDNHQALDEDEMRLQVGIYAVAAKRELEYEPNQGLVRYLDVNYENGEPPEIKVPLDPKSVEEARRIVVETAQAIRDRRFMENPRKQSPKGGTRCATCDFLGFCGMGVARRHKAENPGDL